MALTHCGVVAHLCVSFVLLIPLLASAAALDGKCVNGSLTDTTNRCELSGSIPAVSLLQVSSEVSVNSARARARVATILDPTYVELVVASVCEDLTWFLEFPGPVSIYSKNKSCTPQLRSALDTRPNGHGLTRVVELENIGREGHSYMKHIVDNYDSLAPWTAFTQGKGEHNAVQDTKKLREFLSLGKGPRSGLLPIVHKNEKGLILYRDADADEKTIGMDEETNVYIFGFSAGLDMPNRARAVYVSLFGGSACDAPPMVFSAGAQFIVSRETIRAKPKSFYQFLLKALEDCYAYSWDLERMWLFVFNASLTPLAKPTMPRFCSGASEPKLWKTWNCTEYRKQQGVLLFM